MKRRALPLLALCCLTFASGLRAADPIYAGASYGLFKSTDAGATWNLLNIPLNSPFLQGSLLAHWLAMDPHNPSKIYMIGSAKAVAFFASADAGATWTITPFIGLQPTHLAVDFAGKVIYISASDTQDILSLYKSTDTGKTWTRLILPNTQENPVSSNPFGIPVNHFLMDPAVSGTVYVPDAGNHLFKSTDFGSTWTDIWASVAQNLKKDPTYADPHNHSIWYAVTGGLNSALFKSTDGATTFSAVGIPSNTVTSVAVGAVSSTVYATGDVAGLGATVLKSTDGGNTWKALENGLFTSEGGLVWADPADASTVYVNDSIYADSFYVSTDAGATFKKSLIPEGPPGCVPGNCLEQTIYDFLIAVPAATTPPPPPAIWDNGVVNGASYQPGIVPNSWVSIGGTHLAPKTDNWANAIVDGKFPTELDGVSVKIGGKPAYINFISPGQINLVAPDVGFGSLPVTVTTPGGTSPTFMVTSKEYGPAFFQWPGSQPIATRLDYSDAVKDGTLGVSTVPAKPGETIVLWGTGFGPTNPIAPPGDQVPGGKTYSTTTLPKVTIDKVSAKVYGAALAAGFTGLYQVAIQIPESIRDGDWPIQATIGGVESPTGVVLTVHQ